MGHSAGVPHLFQMKECLEFDYHLSDFIEEELRLRGKWYLGEHKVEKEDDGWL